MRISMKAAIVSAATVMAAAVPLAAPAQTIGLETMVPAEGTVLDITAEGRTTRVPDVATIRAGVVSQASSAAAALSDTAARMARVLAALKRAGVAPRDVATAAVGLSPQYRYAENATPVITGYQATNGVTIRFRDVAKAGPILDALVAEGANQIDGPSLSIDRPEIALDEARADAVKRARARATLYASAAGMKVARLISISEAGQDAGGNGPQPMVYARTVSAEAKSQVVPGERDVTATLSVRFLLQ